MFRETLLGFLLLVGSLGTVFGQDDKNLGDAHSAYICGLTIGMTPQEVLVVMKRPPDVGQVQREDIVSGWQLPGGDFVSVRFHEKQFVSYLTLDYHPVRQRRDMWLPSQFEYEIDETQNGERLIWYRQQKEPRGYNIEIGFQSGSRLKVGERDYKNQITSRYVAVRKTELRKFEQAMIGIQNHPKANAGNKADSEKKH